MKGILGDNRPENLAAVPRNGDIGGAVAPYRARIRQLELELKEKENA